MPRATVGYTCIAVSVVVLPAVAAYQVRCLYRRQAALSALRPDVHLDPATTFAFAETFAEAVHAGDKSRRKFLDQALAFIRYKLSARPIGSNEWNDVVFMLTVLA